MDLNLVSKSQTNRSAEVIRVLREKLKDAYVQAKDQFYEEDFKKLMNDDWYIKRFYLARNRNIDNALNMIVETMKWRKEMQFYEMKDDTFPFEFYKIGGLFIYEKDKFGNQTVYLRVCMHRKVPELQEYSKKFLLHTLNKADKMTGGSGLAIVFDLSRTSYANLDWNYLRFLINSGTNYFPVGVKYILVVNIPWILNTFRKFVYSMLPETWLSLLKFAQGDEIFNFIDKENVPDYLGGTCRQNYRAFPKSSPSIFNVIHDYGYGEEDVKRIMPVYKEILDEADEALKSGSYIDRSSLFEEEVETEIVNLNSRNFKLRIDPQKYIVFSKSLNGSEVSSKIIIYNENSSSVGFKLQSTKPEKYHASPRLGIVLPKMSLSLQITLIDGFSVDPQKDKFMLMALPLQSSNIEPGGLSKLWTQKSNQIFSYKLYCRNPRSRNTLKVKDSDIDKDVNKLNETIVELNKKVQRTWKIASFLLFIQLLFFVTVVIHYFYSDKDRIQIGPSLAFLQLW